MHKITVEIEDSLYCFILEKISKVNLLYIEYNIDRLYTIEEYIQIVLHNERAEEICRKELENEENLWVHKGRLRQ
jgi:hypothetical protein